MTAWPFPSRRAPNSSATPLHGLRLVTTLPPQGWFGGNNLVRAREYALALRELGATVYEFDTLAIYDNDHKRIEQQRGEVTEFRPDAAIGTPHAGYIVQGCMRRETVGPPGSRALNLLIEELNIPCILYWDHALTQGAHYMLQPEPASSAESQGGALQTLRNLFTHPNIVHLFPDSGHATELNRLGLNPSGAETWYVQGAGRAFMESRHDTVQDGFVDDVAFFGNIYLAASSRIPYAADPTIARLRANVMCALGTNATLSIYHAYLAAIKTLGPAERARLRMEPEQSYYWSFLYNELSRHMNGEERLRVLRACGRPVTFYGNFNDPDSNAMMPTACKPRGVLPYGPQLARQFRQTRVTIDVANASFISGFSVKLLDCFAAGGFALTSRKTDVTRALGSLANEISYDSTDQLAAKVEFFLGHDRQRNELAADIASLVRRNYSAQKMFAHTVPPALERLRRTARRRFLGLSRALSLDPAPPRVRRLARADLMQLAAAPNWTGASVTHDGSARVQTAAAPWSYSAQLPVGDLRGKHDANDGALFWEIDAEVAAGEVGFSLLRELEVIAERMLKSEDGRRTIYLIAHPRGAELMVRNGSLDTASRATVHSVGLVRVTR